MREKACVYLLWLCLHLKSIKLEKLEINSNCKILFSYALNHSVKFIPVFCHGENHNIKNVIMRDFYNLDEGDLFAN